MKVEVRNGESKTGYVLVEVHDDGYERIVPIDKRYKRDGVETTHLWLPKNSLGRSFVSSVKVDEAGGCLVLEEREHRTLGSRKGRPVTDYMSEEDRITYETIYEKAMKKKQEIESRPLSEVEKAKKAYEKALAEYKKVMEEVQA